MQKQLLSTLLLELENELNRLGYTEGTSLSLWVSYFGWGLVIALSREILGLIIGG